MNAYLTGEVGELHWSGKWSPCVKTALHGTLTVHFGWLLTWFIFGANCWLCVASANCVQYFCLQLRNINNITRLFSVRLQAMMQVLSIGSWLWTGAVLYLYCVF